MRKKNEIEAFAERPLCKAPTKSGGPCQSRAMRNSSRCRSHGGNTPAAIDAARVRALRQADPLMAKLHALAFNDNMPPQVQLEAIKHALKVTGAFEGKQAVEIELIGASKAKTFEDFAVETLIDVAEDDDDFDAYAQDIVDAEIVTDDDPPLMTRHDRAAFSEVERVRTPRPTGRPGGMSDVERKRRESAALAEQGAADAAHDLAERNREHEAILLAKANGTYNPSSRGEAMREAARTTDTGKRRARITEATFSDGKAPRRRRE